MKLIITTTICALLLRVESQSLFNQDQNVRRHDTDNLGPSNNYQFAPISQQDPKRSRSELDSYLQAISRSGDSSNQQHLSQKPNDGSIIFESPSEDLSPPPFGPNSSHNYYASQAQNSALPLARTEASIPVSSHTVAVQESVDNAQEIDHSTLNNVTIALSRFGLNLLKTTSALHPGNNVIISPTSIATVLALLQQGATGESRDQITKALRMTPEATEEAYSTITTNMRKRNSRNILSIATNILLADAFELNNAFKTLATRTFWSEVTPLNFNNPSVAVQRVNDWVASKTNYKIPNLLAPGSLSTNTQLVLVNAVYFKGIWETRFKTERTAPGEFYLSDGSKKTVPFMRMRHSFKVGIDRVTRALVTILPFEGHQYTLMLILPSKKDNVANLLSLMSVDQLVYYHTFPKFEIKLEIPKFVLKTDTDLNPVLKSLGITNIFGSNSDLSGIGLHRNFSPHVSNAVHSGFLSIDEQGVIAAAATSIAAVALSYDDSTTTFRAERPFLAILWDQQFSIPLFIAKIEDPS